MRGQKEKKNMSFRRFRSGARRMFQSKQFVLSLDVLNNTQAGGFFANDVILISADTVLGISNTVQGALKRISVVGIDYYVDGVITVGADTTPVIILFNYFGLYKDTLDPSSVPDASGTFFLNADQVSGTVNQQLFPQRIIDRRSFTIPWQGTNITGLPSGLVDYFNPGMSAERRVRRRVSLNAREALIFRVEAFVPQAAAGQSNELAMQVYGVVTYRVDL